MSATLGPGANGHDTTTQTSQPSSEGVQVPSAEEYDALAELFLGEDGESAHPHRTDCDRGAPWPRLVSQQPSHSRNMAPEQAAQTVVAHGTGRSKSKSNSTSHVVEKHPVSPIELLVLGHLPVRAAPWVAQHARTVSEHNSEVVALARVGDGNISIDLIGLSQNDTTGHGRPSVYNAIEHAARHADRWMIVVPPAHIDAMHQTQTVAQITLLTGADEAAIVSAYQTLKQLAHDQPADSLKSTLTPAPTPALQFAIMGAEDEDADASGETLREACGAFLSQPVKALSSVARIEPTGAVTVFRGRTDGAPAKILARIDAARRTTPECSFPSTDAHAETHKGETSRLASPIPLEPTSPPMIETRVVSPVFPHAAPRTIVVESAGDTAQPSSLAKLIPGLRSLQIQCPNDTTIEFAVDEQGALHLLCDARTQPDAVTRLTSVSAWAEKHGTLLAMAAAPDQRIDADRPITQHLFTPSAKSVRPLLDTTIRIHLLTPIDPQNAPPCVCSELN